jgi:serine protease AprX
MKLYKYGLLVFALLAGCSEQYFGISSSQNGQNNSLQTVHPITDVHLYDDVRWCDMSGIGSQLDSEMVKTLWYNKKSVWPPQYSNWADTVMERAKTPGLSIRKIHASGITGKGVRVAIIDQNICLDHPEYTGKIVEYHDVGCNQPSNSSSMHGPAVASLLVGTTIGTAPDARVYFAAAPSWTADAQYQADALNWILDVNAGLPDSAKIRAVSISAAPSGPGSPFTKNNSSWDAAVARAEKADVLVLDCTSNKGHTSPGYYDSDDPDDVAKCKSGFPGVTSSVDTARIYVPCSNRTQAEEYEEGFCSYQYTGRGGLSWTIPYLTGVLALGWQLRPDLSGETLMTLIMTSAHRFGNGIKFINPPAFIDSVKAFKK